MFKQFITILLIFLTTFAPGMANAQGRERIEIDIPFSFILKERILPAGKYVLERTDPGRPNILTLRNRDRSIVRPILMQRVEKKDPSTASSLVFIQRDGELYLFQVWNVGAVNGAQVPSALDKQTRDRRDESLTLVTLRAQDH